MQQERQKKGSISMLLVFGVTVSYLSLLIHGGLCGIRGADAATAGLPRLWHLADDVTQFARTGNLTQVHTKPTKTLIVASVHVSAPSF